MIAEPSQHETVATEYLQEAKIVPKTNLFKSQPSLMSTRKKTRLNKPKGRHHQTEVKDSIDNQLYNCIIV